MKKTDNRLVILFLMTEAVLYWLLMTQSGETVRWSSYGAIALCTVFGLLHFKTGNKWLIFGLLCTLGADFWLVAYRPQQQFWGMVFFLGTQSCYAVALWKCRKNKALLITRLALVAVAELVTVIVLGEKTDALALISLAYYAMLIMNIVAAFNAKYWMFAVALVLFLLCDTVIGLQVAAGGYLPIGEESPLYKLLFSGFNLSWLFYLPSQVLIALCSAKRRKRK